MNSLQNEVFFVDNNLLVHFCCHRRLWEMNFTMKRYITDYNLAKRNKIENNRRKNLLNLFQHIECTDACLRVIERQSREMK